MTDLVAAPALAALEEDEAYLFALLSDTSGIDTAELLFVDRKNEDNCFRLRGYQWAWYRCMDAQQAELSARTVGKSMGIQLRAIAHVLCNPGYDMGITAPERVHLDGVIQAIEDRILSCWLTRELLPKGRFGASGGGTRAISHHPFLLSTVHGSRIEGRLPQRDGHGVKGMHVKWLELDECFPAGTLVTTKRGQVPIEEVIVGDMVLTHKHRWRMVTATSTKVRPTVVLKGHGHPGLEASVNHPFWGARQVQSWHKYGELYTITDDGRLDSQIPLVQPEQWIPALEMEGNWWCSPTAFPSVHWIPSFRGVGQHGARVAPPCSQDNVDFFWMVGLWIAEGCVSRGQVYFSIHQDEVAEVRERFTRLGISPTLCMVANCRGVNLIVNKRDGGDPLGTWLGEHCGKGAHNKEIPPWVLGLKEEYRRALFEGLVYGDGFFDKDTRYASGRWKLTTVSKKLAVSMRLLALSLGYSVSWYWNPPRKKPSVIRGREVKPTGFYQVVGNVEGQGFEFKHDRYTQVRSVIDTGTEKKLYDLTVEEDHSYLIDGIHCSNSQDYPEKGYLELIETCTGEGTVWRCIAEGQLVLTSRGWIPIESVQVGDDVLTHRSRWRPVVRVFDNGTQDCVQVNGQGHPGLIVTPEHKFLISESHWSNREGSRSKAFASPLWRSPVLSEEEQYRHRRRKWSNLHWATLTDPAETIVWAPLEKEVVPVGPRHVYDLEVEEDHSYVVDGIVVSNCHGVVNGVGGWFYNVTRHAVETPPLRSTVKRSETDWTIHRITAQNRPDWTDKERQAKIEKYGSRDTPDYGRNVLGLPGPAENVIFVLHRLMKCCCDDPQQSYNMDEYIHTTIRDTDMLREDVHVLDFLEPNLSAAHKRYGKIYIGMDVGYVNDPSEVLVFAECPVEPDDLPWRKKEQKAIPRKGQDQLKLLHRISLRNIPTPDQVEVILKLVEFYQPISFAMDRTGNGLPLYQDIIRALENKVEETRSGLAQLALSTIKGYNFSENVLVEIDPVLREQLPPGLSSEEIAKEAGIYRRVVEVSTDELRELVDTERLWLPYDVELIGQFNGQTFRFSKVTTDLYGRRRLFSDGDFHCLDAARMAVLARKQQGIDEFLNKKPERSPVLDRFFTPSGFRPKDLRTGQTPPAGRRQGAGW